MNKEEKKTIGIMISMYCSAKHGTNYTLCLQCSELRSYAFKRLSYCKYGEDKPTCEKCPTHCYAPKMRDKIKEVMRFAGPRMLFRHPILAIKHLLRNRSKSI